MTDQSLRSDDDAAMRRFSYTQQLKRSLHLFGSFAVAFSFISITTGIFTNYGFVLSTAGPAGIWTWPLVAVGQTLVAIVFAELAVKIPVAGYSYQWLRRMNAPRMGWFLGWISFSFLVLVVPAVDFGLAPLVAELLGMKVTPSTLTRIVLSVLALQATINIIGVKLAARINNAAVFTEAIGILGLTIFLFVHAFSNPQFKFDILVDTTTAAVASESYMIPFILSSLMGAFTLVGFEAAANLSEETVNAGHVVPRAIILSVILSGFFGTLFLIAATLSISSASLVVNMENPLTFIIQESLGPVIGTLFIILVIISIFACGLVITASGARLVFAMARDGQFFFNDRFKQVSSRHQSPVAATLLVFVLGAVVAVFSRSLTLLVGATSVLPAVIYLITIVTYVRRRHKLSGQYGAFTMGKWAVPIFVLSIGWLVLELAVLTVPREFHAVTYTAGAIMAVGAILQVLFFSKA